MIGHKAKTNDELPEVAALLRALPRVSAPADFNARLKARIAAAQAEANEFVDVTTLLKELPRVAAPADFDFRLRARIAQAKARQQETSAGWLAELFGRTFSWAQAATAMAAVAVVVSLATFGVLRSGKEVRPTDKTPIAKVQPSAPAPTVVPTEALGSNQADVRIPDVATNAAVRTLPVRSSSTIRRSPSIHPVPPPPVIGAEAAPTLVASKVMIKHRSGAARMIDPSEYNFGLQTANLRPTPVKATPSTGEASLSASIY
jgi:hypothetical protein